MLICCYQAFSKKGPYCVKCGRERETWQSWFQRDVNVHLHSNTAPQSHAGTHASRGRRRNHGSLPNCKPVDTKWQTLKKFQSFRRVGKGRYVDPLLRSQYKAATALIEERELTLPTMGEKMWFMFMDQHGILLA